MATINNAQLLGLGSLVTDPNAMGSYDTRWPYLSRNEVNAKDRQIAMKYDSLATRIDSISETRNSFGGQIPGRTPAGTIAKASAEFVEWRDTENRKREQLAIQKAQVSADVQAKAAASQASAAQKAAADAQTLATLLTAGLINKSTAVNQAADITKAQANTYTDNKKTENEPQSKGPNWLLIGGIGLGVAALVTAVVIATK